MEIETIRRKNIELLLPVCFGGVKRQLALKLDIDTTSISRFFMADNPTKSARDFSSKFCRKLEKISNLELGWIDSIKYFVPKGTNVFVVNEVNQNIVDKESMTTTEDSESEFSAKYAYDSVMSVLEKLTSTQITEVVGDMPEKEALAINELLKTLKK